MTDTQKQAPPQPPQAPEAEASQFDLFGINVEIRDEVVFGSLTLAEVKRYLDRMDWTKIKTGARWHTYQLNGDRLWLPVKYLKDDHAFSMRKAFRDLARFEGKNELLLLAQIKDVIVESATEATEASPLPSEAESKASSYEAFGPMHCSQYLPVDGQKVQFFDEKNEVWRQGWYKTYKGQDFGDKVFIWLRPDGGTNAYVVGEHYQGYCTNWWQAPFGPPPDEARKVAKVGSEVVTESDNTKLYIYSKEDDENVNPHA